MTTHDKKRYAVWDRMANEPIEWTLTMSHARQRVIELSVEHHQANRFIALSKDRIQMNEIAYGTKKARP